MLLVMQCKIVFPATDKRKREIVLHKVSGMTFESSYKEIVSRGELTLPRNIKPFENNSIRKMFSKGDPVIISFGYGYEVKEEFRGYLSEISADIPVVLKFEDEMFKINKLPVNFSSPNISLENLLKKIIPGYTIEVLDGVELGAVRLSDTQVGPVLDKLKQSWGFMTYFKDGKVICGKYVATETDTPEAKFDLERTCVSTALNYKKKEDVLVRIKCVSTLKNGKKLEVEIGDKDLNADVLKLPFMHVTVKAELEKQGKLAYNKYKQDRFDGSFTAFGIPSVRHGMKSSLTSQQFPDREGKYYIEKVTKTFDDGGIRQEISLGARVVPKEEKE
ncbi:hypothetical protein MYRA21_0071 [Myroides sp. A21]|nr:hypothetical protein MYRA21_0071 [Myroides sp. A21]